MLRGTSSEVTMRFRLAALLLSLVAASGCAGSIATGAPSPSVIPVASPSLPAVPSATNAVPATPARGVFLVEVVPAATADACPSIQDGYLRLLQGLDRRIAIGSVVRQFTVQSFEARYSAAGGIDELPPFAGFDPAAPPVRVPA